MVAAKTTKFIIGRTSSWDGQPCEEAYKFTPPYRWHERTCTEDEFNKRFSDREGLWRSRGAEHATSKNGEWIKRKDFDTREMWAVDIDDIYEFSKKYGQLVVSAETAYDLPSIEIYDSYRE